MGVDVEIGGAVQVQVLVGVGGTEAARERVLDDPREDEEDCSTAYRPRRIWR